MPNNSKSRGSRAEDLVVECLLRKNCKILARNYHSRFGEIDIIIEKSGIWAIEVKLSNNDNYPFRNSQIGKILTTLRYWVIENGYSSDNLKGIIGCKVTDDIINSLNLKCEFTRLL